MTTGTTLALEAVLEPLHQELMLAQSGEDALRLCLDHDFAAILLDVRMPEFDGFETAALIRSRKKSRHTPILFLTAYRSDEQLFRGYDLGAVDFLFKPIVPEVLQSKVSVFVHLSRSEQLLRREAEELTRAEHRFRAVLEAAPDSMLITSNSGAIELSNSRTDALFGYPREALIGRNILDLIPGWEPTLAPAAPLTEKRLTAVRRNGSIFPARSPAARSSLPASGSSPRRFATLQNKWKPRPESARRTPSWKREWRSAPPPSPIPTTLCGSSPGRPATICK